MSLKLAATLAFLALVAVTPAQARYMSANEIIMSIGTDSFVRAADKVSSASSAAVERLSTYLGAKTAGPRLARAEANHRRALRFLHNNLRQNPIVMQAIRASAFEVEDIVALTIDSEGSAILYGDDLN